jgi:hypothetical protein
MKSVKDIVIEKIELLTNPEAETEQKGLNFWLLIPAAVLVVGTVAFFVVRRMLTTKTEK